MITPKKIIPEVHEFFDPNGKSLGWLNEYEMYDLCMQIKDENAEGYYFTDEDDVKIHIMPSGQVPNTRRVGSVRDPYSFTNNALDYILFNKTK